MSINLTVPSNTDTPELKPRITVIGVGGGGGNAVNNMIRRELEGVDFVVANTDAQALAHSKSERRIQLGASVTEGLGAGSRPDVGRTAADEALETILDQLGGSHMVFIAAGMGGGTGTGAAPVIARAAKEAGMLTVGVVTKPFQFEGTHRMRLAESGIEELEQYVDSLIIIPNQNLFRIANENTTFADAFSMADEVLYSGVRGVTDLMVMPGLMNLDFADVRSVMSEMGKAMMGTGEAEGERRALDAAEAAIANPLLDDTSMKGARGVLINITGGKDITLFEVDEAATRIRAEVDQDAYIIFGSAFDGDLEGRIRVSVIATGIDTEAMRIPQPTMLNLSDIGSARRIERVEEPQPATPEILEATEQATADETEPAAEESAAEMPTSESQAAAEAVDESDAGEELPEIVDIATVADDAGSAESETAEAAEVAGSDEAFIPPPAVSADSCGQQPAADPFAAAAMTNGASEPKPEVDEPTASVVRPSLFERVTRTGRAAAATTPSENTAETGEVMENKGLSTNEEVEETTDSPSGEGALTVAAELSEEPTNIAELDIEEPASAEAAEEDLLDIPAFLRRQAN